jgi:predicted lipid-binding transport protein (Tim44 family)
MRRRHTGRSAVRWLQFIARITALAAAVFIGADDVDVPLVGGLSFAAAGSGAVMVFVSAAEADTAPTRIHLPAAARASTYAGGSLNGLFNRGGLLGGFAAGFLGSGVLGLLFDRGLFSGLSSVQSYLGLLFQLALLALLGRLIWTRWRGGATALSPRQLADPYLRSRQDLHAGFDSAAGRTPAADADAKQPTAAMRTTSRVGGTDDGD